MSDQSVAGLSDRSAAHRPAMFGTLSAADEAARGSYQLPGRSPAAGIINFSSSNGIFNLPRYYPTTYQQFDNDSLDGASSGGGGSTWRSGEHQRTIPFYRDDPVGSEPIYARPNKSSRRSGVSVNAREQFTVALDSDLDSSSATGCRSCCCWPRTRTCRDSKCRKSKCERRRQRNCTLRPICVCTVVAFILLVLVAVAVGVFLAVFLLVTIPGHAQHAPRCNISLAKFLQTLHTLCCCVKLV